MDSSANQTLLSTRARYVVVALVLVACCTAVMTPRLLSPRFGLLDDGTTLLIAENYTNNPLGVLDIERDRGRFRPVYWFYYIGQYPMWGTAPTGYFLVQVIALTATTLLISGTVAEATHSLLAGMIAGITFILSGPIWEAYYTLSKPEPPLVLWLSAAAFCLFGALKESTDPGGRRRTMYLVCCACLSSLAYLTKETAVVMLPVSILLAWAGWSNKIARGTLRAYVAINAACFLGFLSLRYVTTTSAVSDGSDSQNYILSGNQLYASGVDALAWIARDFAFAIPIGVCGAFAFRRCASRCVGSAGLVFMYGAILSAAWMAIMLPWHSTFEYYLLPVSLGIALLVGGGLYLIRPWLRRRSAGAVAAITLSALLAWVPLVNGYAAGRLQLLIDESNGDLLAALAGLAPQGGTIVMDLPNDSEYVFELTMQLRELYGRADVVVTGSDPSQPDTASGELVVFQQVRNKPVIMPRVVTTTPQPSNDIDRHLTSLWSVSRDLQVTFGNAQEPLCRVARQLNAVSGLICHDPVPVLDQRAFEYGWRLYRTTG